jgi:hypothetical protein
VTDGRKRLVVLMTDGQSESGDRTAAMAALKTAGVPVIAIAFGRDADPKQLTEVAAATGGAFVRQDDMVTALRQAAAYKCGAGSPPRSVWSWPWPRSPGRSCSPEACSWRRCSRSPRRSAST